METGDEVEEYTSLLVHDEENGLCDGDSYQVGKNVDTALINKNNEYSIQGNVSQACDDADIVVVVTRHQTQLRYQKKLKRLKNPRIKGIG